MIKNITDYLDKTEQLHGNKLAYADENRGITLSELKRDALKIAECLLHEANIGTPVLVYMDKCVECIESFLGIAYTGAFYVPIDSAMPIARVMMIANTLSAHIVVAKDGKLPDELKQTCSVYWVEDMLQGEKNNEAEIWVRQRHCIDTDPCYAIFTPGSTGVPKGVLINRRSVINFTEWWCETFEFTSDEVFANQTPFYFDASVKDIYATLRCGATMHIVPRKLFSLPRKLVEYLNEHEVTCIEWVPSALCMIANFKTLEKQKPEYLQKIMFLGEVMPTKQFNMWRRALPHVKYANLYGPTEATGDCTYYKIEREFDDAEPIPIGYACENTEVMLLDEKDKIITEVDVPGELCVRGCSLALGYYNNPEKTDEVFVQNPLQKQYKERIYRTGDLVRYNTYGELVFISRKDSQVKHMGHRIELGEVENGIQAVEGIDRVCCLFDSKKQQIIAVYQGNKASAELLKILQNHLPSYMLPSRFYQVEEMPINLNGKIDRTLLKSTYLS